MRDLRYAIRMLVKHKAGTAVVLFTLLLVIGTLSLGLGVYQHERSARMPFPNPDRLVQLWQVGSDRPADHFPWALYDQTAPELKTLQAVAAHGLFRSRTLTGHGQPRSLSALRITASMFDVAGIPPLLGRTFTAQEEAAGERVLVLSQAEWSSVFDEDPSLIGKDIRLDGELFTVVGVMPDAFSHNALFYGTDVWLPCNFPADGDSAPWVQIVGRMKPDVSLAQLRAELDAVASPLLHQLAASQGWDMGSRQVSAFPIEENFARNEAGEVVFAVAVPAFVLLIACFNVTHVLLARMAAQRREIAIRLSLGASRGRLIRQCLVESVVLAGCGGVLGLFAAVWVSSWTQAKGVPAEFSFEVIAAVVLVSLVLGLAVGWFPARHATRRELLKYLKDGGGSASGGIERHRLRNFLVGAQVAMATALCIVAGLLVRSYVNRKHFDPGFDTRNLTQLVVSPRDSAYGDPEQRLLYQQRVVERLRDIPGVEQVGVASTSPADPYPFPMGFRLEDDGDQWPRGQSAQLNLVTPEYLDLVNLRAVRGRSLTAEDRRGSPPVLLVNQSFVEDYFPDAKPLGRQIGLTLEGALRWFTIVGVVPDRRSLGFNEDPGAEAFLSATQFAEEWVSYCFLVRTRPDPGLLVATINERVRSVDRDQPVPNAITLSERIETLQRRNLPGTQAFLGIGLFGLLMAVVGLYGVVAGSVVERTHEIGVRMALGATKPRVLTLIARQVMRLTVIGMVVGAGLAAGTTFGMSQLLFGTHFIDPLSYVSVGAVLITTALLACLLPALRATAIKPMEALRYE